MIACTGQVGAFCFSGKEKAHKLKKILGTPAGCPRDSRRDKQGSTSRCPRDFLWFAIEKLALLPEHRPGVPGTPGRPGGFQKFYVMFSCVPFLLPSFSITEVIRPIERTLLLSTLSWVTWFLTATCSTSGPTLQLMHCVVETLLRRADSGRPRSGRRRCPHVLILLIKNARKPPELRRISSSILASPFWALLAWTPLPLAFWRRFLNERGLSLRSLAQLPGGRMSTSQVG